MLLKVKNLVKVYQQKNVVDHLSLEIQKGEIVGLLGPNGAGKTTAFYIIMGLIAPTEGDVYFEDENITKKEIHKRAKMGMGYLAQEPSIFGSLSVEENILCILEMLDLTKAERKARCEELLNELHLGPHAKKRASALSGGERRRLEITRALITEPKLLLLDEPFANVDPIAISEVKGLIRILKQKGISVLITDHNAREIFSIADRSYVMQEGKVVISGTTGELIESSLARSVYLGDDFKI